MTTADGGDGGAFQPPSGQQSGWPAPYPGGGQPPQASPPPQGWAPPSGGGADAGRFRPMTLADVLDGMFRLFLSNWRTYAVAVGLVVIPQSFLSAMLAHQMGMSTGLLEQLSNPAAAEATFQAGPELWALGAIGGLTILVALFVTPYVNGVACRIAGSAYEGDTPQPGEVLRFGLGRYWSLLGATVLLGLIALAVLAVPSGLLIAGGVTGNNGFLAAGGLLMVVALPLVIWFMVRLTLAYPAIVMERLGAVAALRRSYGLVAGRWWRVFGTLLLAQIITGIVSQIAAVPFSIPGQLFGGVIAVILVALGTVLASIVTTPLAANAQTLLYFDGRVRREGYDLDVRSRQVAADVAGGPLG